MTRRQALVLLKQLSDEFTKNLEKDSKDWQQLQEAVKEHGKICVQIKFK